MKYRLQRAVQVVSGVKIATSGVRRVSTGIDCSTALMYEHTTLLYFMTTEFLLFLLTFVVVPQLCLDTT